MKLEQVGQHYVTPKKKVPVQTDLSFYIQEHKYKHLFYDRNTKKRNNFREYKLSGDSEKYQNDGIEVLS